MLPKKSTLRYQKELKKCMSEWKLVSESEVNERKTFTNWELWIQSHFLGRYRTKVFFSHFYLFAFSLQTSTHQKKYIALKI
jgi:hypothetical protein